MSFRVKTENEIIHIRILTFVNVTLLNSKATQLVTFNISGSV